MTQAAASALILLLVVIFLLPSYSGAVDPSSLSVVQTNDSADAGGKNILDVQNKKVFQRERKRHTARRVASPWPGRGGGYLPWQGGT